MDKERMTHTERAARRQQIAEAVATGLDVARVACNFGVSCECAYMACREHGVATSGRRGAPPRAMRKLRIIADMLNTRGNYAAIARRHGVTRQYASLIAQQAIAAGMPIKRRLDGSGRIAAE